MSHKVYTHINTNDYDQLDEDGLQEVSVLNKNYKVLFEMLLQRGYTIPSEDLAFLELDNRTFFDHFMSSKPSSLFETLTRVYSKSLPDGSVKTTMIIFDYATGELFMKKQFVKTTARIQQLIYSQGYTPNSPAPSINHVILVINRPMDKQAKEASKGLFMYELEVFEQDHLLLNPNRHFLVPRQTIDGRITLKGDGTVDRSSLKEFLKETMIADPNKMPQININDPVMIFNNYPTGSIIKIERQRLIGAHLVSTYPTYRYLSGSNM